MAQAGTTTNLRQGPATGTGRQAGFWMVLIAAAVVLAIGIAIVMTQVNAPKSTSGSLSADSLTADRSYDRIESQRGAALSADSLTADRSFDRIEAQRGATNQSLVLLDRGADRGAVSSEPLDHSYVALHPGAATTAGDSYDALRAAAFAATVTTPSVDHSKDTYRHAIGKGPLR